MSPINFPKPHKFKAVHTVVDGLHFPSKLEAAVYSILKLRVYARELTDLRLQHSVCMRVPKCAHCGAQGGSLTWKVDFSARVVASGETLFIEAKGAETSDYKKRKKLWKTQGPGRLEIWKGSAKWPRLVEVIERGTML